MPARRTPSERNRIRLIRQLRDLGVLRSDAIEAAFRTVERERFVAATAAEQGLEAVYRDEAIATKCDPRGLPLSSSSQPSLMAEMLGLLDAQPGDRVLEVGAGTGYNAALLTHIVGARGHVTTIDIDPEIAQDAGRALRDGGYPVSVMVADGRGSKSNEALYDRIIVTACADELAPSWIRQLRDGGRLIVPLRLDPDGAAIQIIPAFERIGKQLHSVGLTWGSFMPLHNGDGGWRPSASTLNASQSSNGQHRVLASLTGAGVGNLSQFAAQQLLGAVLNHAGPPIRHGLTDLSSRKPPLLFVYLLLSIPARRRVSFSTATRMGIGLVDRRAQSLAIISTEAPWGPASRSTAGRARWRLDGYGGDTAVDQLDQLIADWQQLEREHRSTLQITTRVDETAPRLRFAWTAT